MARNHEYPRVPGSDLPEQVDLARGQQVNPRDLDTHLRAGEDIEEPDDPTGFLQRWNLAPIYSFGEMLHYLLDFTKDARQLGSMPVVKRLTFERDGHRWPPRWNLSVHFEIYDAEEDT